jgi:hypothetical protein
MSHRLQVVIPDPVATQLQELATTTGDPPSRLAGQLVRNGVAEAAQAGAVRALRSAPSLVARARRERARWLEPYGGDARWRQEMWGAIVALHGRYPRQLEALNDGWWTDQSHREALCALVLWRDEIDDAGEDPREELAFQRQLADYASALRQQGGGVTRAWKPGAAPENW